MFKILLSFFIAGWICLLPAQSRITFRLEMLDLLTAHIFSGEKGERVFVRGSFNNWQGGGYQLMREGDTGIFSGCFDLKVLPGDTVEYKYVLERSEDQIYWENRPDPQNQNHGNRMIVVSSLLLFYP